MMQSTELKHNPKITGKRNLERCAQDIVQKYQTGALPELNQTGWAAAWKYLLKDLHTCCPGYPEIEYAIALNKAFVE